MNIKRNMKRRDFTRRLVNYAIEGGALTECTKHEGSIYRSDQGLSGAYAVIERAWKTGEISSGLEGAQEQLEVLVGAAPGQCSHVTCWAQGT